MIKNFSALALTLTFILSADAQYNSAKTGIFDGDVSHSFQINAVLNGEMWINTKHLSKSENDFGLPFAVAYEVCWNNKLYARIKYANISWFTKTYHETYFDYDKAHTVYYEYKYRLREYAFIVAVGRVWNLSDANKIYLGGFLAPTAVYTHNIYPKIANKKNTSDIYMEMPFGADFQFKHYLSPKFYLGADVSLGLQIGNLVDADICPVYSAGISLGYTY